MTSLQCDECGDTFVADSLEEVTEDPVTSEALCPECATVTCKSCQRDLHLDDLTADHQHESGGFVCDTCPSVKYPYEFEVTFRREPEGYTPSYIEEVFPDVRLSGDYNADSIPRDFWRLKAHVTFRIDESGFIEPVAVNGEYVGENDD